MLPTYVGTRNVSALFEFCSDVASSHGSLEIDARHVAFIDPLGLAVLTALLSPMCTSRDVKILWLSVGIASYLNKMKFFEHCPVGGVEVPEPTSFRTSSLVEVMRVSNAHDSDAAAARLATALTGKLTSADPSPSLDFNTPASEFERYKHPLEYVFTELLDNALTHARRVGRSDAAVWIAAQHYLKDDLVRFSVTDNGCGFLATLSSHPELKKQSHQSAIELALIPFVSCNRDIGPFATSTNEGVGLTTTRNISEAAGGGMTLVSGDGKFATGSGGAKLPSNAFWQGVAISFVCKRTLLPQIVPADLLPDLPPGSEPPKELRFTD